MTWQGVDQLLDNFDQALRKIEGPMTEGTITKLLIVAQGYSDGMTPVATSNLINSGYRRTYPIAIGWGGQLGYGAHYAAYVHEAPGTLLGTNTPRHPASDGVIWGPGGEPKFLEKGADLAVQNDINFIFREHYRG